MSKPTSMTSNKRNSYENMMNLNEPHYKRRRISNNSIDDEDDENMISKNINYSTNNQQNNILNSFGFGGLEFQKQNSNTPNIGCNTTNNFNSKNNMDSATNSNTFPFSSSSMNGSTNINLNHQNVDDHHQQQRLMNHPNISYFKCNEYSVGNFRTSSVSAMQMEMELHQHSKQLMLIWFDYGPHVYEIAPKGIFRKITFDISSIYAVQIYTNNYFVLKFRIGGNQPLFSIKIHRSKTNFSTSDAIYEETNDFTCGNASELNSVEHQIILPQNDERNELFIQLFQNACL